MCTHMLGSGHKHGRVRIPRRHGTALAAIGNERGGTSRGSAKGSASSGSASSGSASSGRASSGSASSGSASSGGRFTASSEQHHRAKRVRGAVYATAGSPAGHRPLPRIRRGLWWCGAPSFPVAGSEVHATPLGERHVLAGALDVASAGKQLAPVAGGATDEAV